MAGYRRFVRTCFRTAFFAGVSQLQGTPKRDCMMQLPAPLMSRLLPAASDAQRRPLPSIRPRSFPPLCPSPFNPGRGDSHPQQPERWEEEACDAEHHQTDGK